jgi:biotin synthase
MKPNSLELLLNKSSFSIEEIVEILSIRDEEQLQKLFSKAYAAKEKYVGKKAYYRGIVEFSNICKKNCYYCGIRNENRTVSRYEMSEEEMVEAGLFAHSKRYGSVVFQSGEREDAELIGKVDRVVKTLKEKTGGELGITLCVGEQSREVYEKWFESGAHRYLLRIETSSPGLYEKLHPADHSYERRIDCLKTLKDIGYQTGTGTMIGLPYQSYEDMARDLIFFQEQDMDMIGMGPYLVHEKTPFFALENKIFSEEERFLLGLKMIALLRILMKDINIAATTALQALDPVGREKGLLAGANVVMPNITPQKYREDYILYENKPCVNEDGDQCSSCLEGRIRNIGETVGYGEWGDSPHYFSRTGKSE